MNQTSNTKIAIVGCGPAGMVMSIALARRGIRTIVFEQSQHPEVAPRYNADRSYAIDITGHGLKALRYIDACDTFDEFLIPFKGIKVPQMKRTEAWDEQGWIGSRGDIMRALMKVAERKYKDLITVEFEASVIELDIETGSITTQSVQSEAMQTRQYDLIIGADGGGSIVRQKMQEQLSDFTTEYREIPNHSTMLALDLAENKLDKHYLYVLSTEPFTATGAINGESGTDEVKWYCVVGTNHPLEFQNGEDARQYFQQNAPQILNYVSNSALEDFAQRQSHHIGRALTCSRLYGGKAVLLGDAGAPFSPIGQGINAAMESAIEFDACINGFSVEEIQQAVETYSEVWKREADAVTWISEQLYYSNAFHSLRLKLTTVLGINPMNEAKRSDLPYSEVKKQADRLSFIWTNNDSIKQ